MMAGPGQTVLFALMVTLISSVITSTNGIKLKRSLADAMNAATLSRENYGVVLKPGRLMSTADVTHLLQGFRIQIPFQKSQEFRSLNTTQWCSYEHKVRDARWTDRYATAYMRRPNG